MRTTKSTQSKAIRSLDSILSQIRDCADPVKAAVLQKYFQTAPGQYGEGDVFLGVKVPDLRGISKANRFLALTDIQILLKSKFHEHRSLALMILVLQSKKANAPLQKQFYRFYLKNLAHVNQWDLVDGSAEHLIGAYLFQPNNSQEKKRLYQLAKSKRVWDRRVAILATLYFIRRSDFQDTLKLAAHLLQDDHDLIHKAVGWMLREIGERDLTVLKKFLLKNYQKMPRTMLRYAIEKLPETQRKAFLLGKM